MTPRETSTAELALRFLAVYSQVQESCDDTISRRLRQGSPAFGELLDQRFVQRLTDKERIAAIAALAQDLGYENFANVVSVLLLVKPIRDRIGHSILLGLTEDEASPGRDVLWSVKEDSQQFTADDLFRAYWRTWWVMEHICLVSEIAGVGSHDGSPMHRRSGALLRDQPPTLAPPRGEIDDPMVLWEIVDDEPTKS